MWRDSAVAVLCLGIGAGLDRSSSWLPRETTYRKSEQPCRSASARDASCPVAGIWARLLADLTSRAGRGDLFWPTGADPSYKNFVNDFCYGIVADPAAVKLSSLRARSSYICDHLAAGTPLGAPYVPLGH